MKKKNRLQIAVQTSVSWEREIINLHRKVCRNLWSCRIIIIAHKSRTRRCQYAGACAVHVHAKSAINAHDRAPRPDGGRDTSARNTSGRVVCRVRFGKIEIKINT